MRSLELNLATRPFRNNTLLWTGYALLAVAVVAFTAWNTVTFVDTRRALDQLRNTVGSVESRLAAVDQREHSVETRIAKHDVKQLGIRTSRANQFIQRKAFSWTRLFNVLEHIQPYEVKMASVRPIFGNDAAGGPAAVSATGDPDVVPVSVDGIAKNVQAFFDFEDALIADAHIDRIEPERSSRAKNGEILFSLSFLYYPDGLAKKSASQPRQAEILDEGATDGTAGTEVAKKEEDPKAPAAAPKKADKPANAPAPSAAPAPPPQAPAPIAPADAAAPDPGRRRLFTPGGHHTEPGKKNEPVQKPMQKKETTR